MARFGFGLGFRSQSSQFAPIFGSESRNFTTLDASGSKHYTMPVYTMAVGDIVSFTFLAPTSTTSVEYLFDSDTASLRANCLLNIGGSFAVNGFESTMLLDGNSVSTGSTYPIDGKLHTLELTSNTVNEIGRVGSRYSGANTYNGVIFDFKIKRGSDLKRFYKLDETWIGPSTVAVDSGSDGSNGTAVNITSSDSETFTKAGDDWLGVELIINGGFGSGAGWTLGTGWSISGGSANGVGIISGQDLEQTAAINFVAGFTYRSIFTIFDRIVGGQGVNLGGVDGSSQQANGTFTQNILAINSNNFEMRRRSADFTGSLDDISVKRILEGA